MNTNKKRQLSDSKYNQRVEECREGVALLNEELKRRALEPVANACAILPGQLEILRAAGAEDAVFRRIRHCITENQRVKKAVAAMEAGDLVLLGRLMNESHQSLRLDYETTGIELDTLHEEASKVSSCLGARVTGAGFGGCAIALVHKDRCATLIEVVGAAYREKIGYDATFFECTTGDGAGALPCLSSGECCSCRSG